ncbi:peritrophin-44-like [Bradysia coprophila]|uniref:peritrophin-44-like n=1 Tax=Bradysia coprophila TaxID=38358 RepID=UPI00187DCF69|nr:peritrophin-44-like [Bradysia coprophila]
MAIGNCILGLLVISCSIQTIVCQIATACAGVPNGTFVRNSNSCRAYYYCENGEAHGSECPENYLFEPIQQVCHLPSYVECTGCSLYGLQNIPHPMDCTKYYQCVAGVRTLKTCGTNLLFDKSIGDCNAASKIQCVMDYTQVCSEFAGYVKFGDPSDCSRYYTCLYGVAYHQSCAPGLYFKPQISACTFPEEDDFCQDGGALVLPSVDSD